jgi:hypothetical protein
MSDGRKLPVTHPDFVFLPPQWRSSEIIVAFPDGKWDFVYLRNITTISSQGTHPSAPDERKGEFDTE